MEQARFEAAGDGEFRVSGPLDFATVPGVWRASQGLLRDAGQQPSIDLSGVTRVDSAALALVLDWLALGAEREQQLRIVGAPDKLLALARISETEEMLTGAK